MSPNIKISMQVSLILKKQKTNHSEKIFCQSPNSGTQEYVLGRINVVLKMLGQPCLGIYKVVFSMVCSVKNSVPFTYFAYSRSQN